MSESGLATAEAMEAAAGEADVDVAADVADDTAILQIPDLGSEGEATTAGTGAANEQPDDATSDPIVNDPTVIDASFTVTDESPATPASPPALSTADAKAEMARQIREMKSDVADQACEVSRREASLKSANKDFKAMVEELRDLESRFNAGDYGLPFTPGAAAGDQGAQAAPLEGQKSIDFSAAETQKDQTPVAETAKEDDSWRSAPLSELTGLSGKLLETLEDSGLKTMGQLADYTSSGKQLTDLSGIGPGKATKIEEACDEFWARWNSRPAASTSSEGDVAATAASTEETPTESAASSGESAPSEDEAADEAEALAYAAGCEAAIDGKEVTANPHRQGTQLWKAWDRGFQEADGA